MPGLVSSYLTITAIGKVVGLGVGVAVGEGVAVLAQGVGVMATDGRGVTVGGGVPQP